VTPEARRPGKSAAAEQDQQRAGHGGRHRAEQELGPARGVPPEGGGEGGDAEAAEGAAPPGEPGIERLTIEVDPKGTGEGVHRVPP